MLKRQDMESQKVSSTNASISVKCISFGIKTRASLFWGDDGIVTNLRHINPSCIFWAREEEISNPNCVSTVGYILI